MGEKFSSAMRMLSEMVDRARAARVPAFSRSLAARIAARTSGGRLVDVSVMSSNIESLNARISNPFSVKIPLLRKPSATSASVCADGRRRSHLAGTDSGKWSIYPHYSTRSVSLQPRGRQTKTPWKRGCAAADLLPRLSWSQRRISDIDAGGERMALRRFDKPFLRFHQTADAALEPKGFAGVGNLQRVIHSDPFDDLPGVGIFFHRMHHLFDQVEPGPVGSAGGTEIRSEERRVGKEGEPRCAVSDESIITYKNP